MKTILLASTLALTLPLFAAPPANDSFANRTIISNTANYSLSTTNVEATTQSGEGTFNAAMGATIWWEWTAPTSNPPEWVQIDTIGSGIDTILRVNSASGVNGTQLGFNDDFYDGYTESSLTFQPTPGATYFIQVGGYDDGTGAAEGAIEFALTMGASASPEVWPSTVTHSPSTANVTSANATVVTTMTISGVADTVGTAELFYRRPNGTAVAPTITAQTDFTVGPTAPVAASLTYIIPRYSAAGTWAPRVTLVTDNGEYRFGNSTSGRPYLLNLTALTVTNTGTSDTTNPALTAFAISPNPLNVNSGPANLTISATCSDATSGIDTIQVWLYHPDNVDLDFLLPVTLTSGTINSGTWTGTVAIPKEYPSADYSVNILLRDKALNSSSYGAYGALDTPSGGDVTLPILGGGPYWEWAYTEIYPYTDDVDFNQDPNGDGLDNLTCYAYGLESVFDEPRIDLPLIAIDEATGSLRAEYYRRVGASGVTYTPQFSDNLVSWTDATTAATVLDADATWELVELFDSETTSTKTSRYSRVKVSYTDF